MFNLSKLANILLLTAIPLCGGAILSACSSDKDEPVPTTETNKNESIVRFTMRLRAGGPSSRAESRATKTTTYEDTGTANENYIDLDKVHVFLYDSSSNGTNGLWGGVSLNIELEPTTKEVVDLDNGEYEITCDVPKDNIGDSFRIVVTANWPYNPEKIALTSVDNCYKMSTNYECWLAWLNNGDYPYEYGTDSEGNTTYFEPSASTPIPMYGVLLVKEYTKSDAYQTTNSTVDMLDLGIVYMFRAMAKIVVIDDDAMKYNKVTSFEKVTMSKCLNRGMCAPNAVFSQDTEEITDANISTPAYDTTTYNYKQDCTTQTIGSGAIGINYPSQFGIIENLPLKKVNDYKFVAYVPEYALNCNKTSNSITVNTGVPQLDILMNGNTYTVEFKDYKNGTATGSAFNILRNHTYEYHVSIASKYIISYIVKEWDVYNSDTITFE
jgi:hypothetical protein